MIKGLSTSPDLAISIKAGELSDFNESSQGDSKIEIWACKFIVANSDKVRIKKNKEIILGFIVWDVDDIDRVVYSFDNSQSIVDAFPNHKINILKWKFLDSDFDR